MSLQYRKDIDGLRAIAVLLVVVFHVYPRDFSGGFIGVDVFFVISGFLITGLIRSGLAGGSFRLLDFYARRIRRIFPALAVVLAACLALGWVLLFPADYRNLGKHAAASAAFVANFTLLQDAGYFDQPAAFKPLLHLWSLGIEEQFYLLWPALMMLTWRWRAGPLLLACAVFVLSFAWNVALSRSNTVAAFFLPTTRFWELMVGCMLALVPSGGGIATLLERAALQSWHRDAASLLGLVLIGLAAALIGHDSHFPGWWALLPTLGAALVIAAGPAAAPNRLVLSQPWVVGIGLISYPLYLWHWPLLAFVRHFHFREPPDLMRWGAIVVAFALAYATYRYIERPIRSGAPGLLRPLGASLAVALTGSIGLAVFAGDGLTQRFPKDLAALLDDDDNVAHTFVGSGLCLRPAAKSAHDLTHSCERSAGSDIKLVVLWGDSHGANLARGLVELERQRKTFHLVLFVTVGCPPIPSYPYSDPTLADCPHANRTAVEGIRSLKPDVVILSGNWESYGWQGRKIDERSIDEVVARLKELGVPKILGVGQFPIWDYPVPKLIGRLYRTSDVSMAQTVAGQPMRNSQYVDPQTFATDRRVGQWFRSAGAGFVSPLPTLCNDQGCLMTVPGKAEPIDRDENHMTNSGSIWFVGANAAKLVGEEP